MPLFKTDNSGVPDISTSPQLALGRGRIRELCGMLGHRGSAWYGPSAVRRERERERQRDTERDTERNREGLRARETEIEIEPPVDAGCGNRRCRRICFFCGQRSTWTTRTIFAPSKSAPCICTLCHPTSMPSCQALIASWFPPEARVLGSQTDMSAASGNCIQHIGLGFKGSQWRSL